MRTWITVLTAALVVAPVSMAQQTRGAETAPGASTNRVITDPARLALEMSEELGLTGKQITELDAIQARLHAANEPLLEQLREAMPEQGAQRRRFGFGLPGGGPADARRRAEAIRPLMEELRENQQQAEREVASVLTPQQQAVLDSRRGAQPEWQRREIRRGLP